MHASPADTPRRVRQRTTALSRRATMHLPALFLAASLLTMARPVAALDLIQAWQAAAQNDPELAAAHAAFDAGQTRREQARSLWRPTIELSAGAGKAHSETQTQGAQFSAPAFGTSTDVAFDTSINSGTATHYAITAKQALYDPKRQAQSHQLTLSADIAQADWIAARQQTILRTAERYFDVLVAEHKLGQLRQQLTAIERLQAQTRTRFNLGDTPITDVHEIDASAQAIQAQVLLADVDLQLKQTAFMDATGLSAQGLSGLQLDNTLLGTAPNGSLDDWLQRTSQHNPTLQKQETAQSVAQEQANQYKASSTPTLELVGSAGRSRLQGSGQFGDASNTANDWAVGVQLRIPLYSGGYRSARYAEALHQRDEVRFGAKAARQKVDLMTRAAWLSLSTGHSRISALRQSLLASQARRDATLLGVSVGDRTTLDWLDAENAVTQSSLALVQTMAELALDRLRLQAQVGALDEGALGEVNCVLEGGTCTTTK